MGKGFDTFMENPYWRKQYEDAPSENLKEYYRIVFDTSGFITGEQHDNKQATKRLEALPLSIPDIEYLMMYSGSEMARAFYKKYADKLKELGDEHCIPASAFQAEERNPYYQVFPQINMSQSSSVNIRRVLKPAEFEEIRQRILAFTDDEDDFLIVELELSEVDASFIQAKRHGDYCYVEVGYDIQLPRQCSPLLVGKELTFDAAIDIFSKFCVQGESIDYHTLFGNGYRIIRFQQEATEHWDVITNDNGILLYEGFVRNGKPYGAGTVFFPNGVVYQEGIFGIKGLLCGNEYYPNGELRFEGLYQLNDGYGPNYPICGRFYDETGRKQFEGKFELRRSGLGYPFIENPKSFGPVSQKTRPSLQYTMWRDAEPEEAYQQLIDK